MRIWRKKFLAITNYRYWSPGFPVSDVFFGNLELLRFNIKKYLPIRVNMSFFAKSSTWFSLYELISFASLFLIKHESCLIRSEYHPKVRSTVYVRPETLLYAEFCLIPIIWDQIAKNSLSMAGFRSQYAWTTFKNCGVKWEVILLYHNKMVSAISESMLWGKKNREKCAKLLFAF